MKRLRRDERTHHLPVFILSNEPKGRFTSEMVARLGAAGWLEKTRTTPADLAEAVAEAFEGFAAGAEL